MKEILSGLVTAFSLYSVIPMPKTDWNGAGMRYTMCFFPLVGAVTGMLQLAWWALALELGLTTGLTGAVAVLLPLAINGGIHMDGFMDTADAMASHGVREKKLDILKDSHVGAFGVLYCGGYLLLSYGLWQQVGQRPSVLLLVAAGYVVSRCLSGISMILIPMARPNGMLRQTAGSADKKIVLLVNIILAGLTLAGCTLFFPLWGMAAAVVSVVIFLLHRHKCLWEFGGNTGDLAGDLLQKTELGFLLVAAAGSLTPM